MKKLRYLPLLLLFALTGCESDDDLYQEIDYNKIRYVLADNYNLNIFGRIVRNSGLESELSRDGDFTLLAPSNAAILAAGYDTATVHTLPWETLAGIVNYHLLDGHYELDKLPLAFNQELESRGGKIYVTRWAKDGDTTLTVNGQKFVPPINYPTNNGLIQIVDKALTPISHPTIVELLGSRQELVLFSYIVQRSGLKELLSGDAQFTLFAPNNEAVKTFGLSSLQDIEAADTEELAKIVRYHLMAGRRHQQDFILSLPNPPDVRVPMYLYNGSNTNPASTNGFLYNQTGYMYDGNRVTMSVRKGTIYGGPNPRDVEQFVLTDAAASKDCFIAEPDLVAENGIVHIATSVMTY